MVTPRKSVALILAANYPDGVRALATFFRAACVDVIVHVDRKTDIVPFRSSLENEPGVYFLEDRTEVFWGGFSMVTATKSLIDHAYARDTYDFFLFLSDDSLPLISLSMMVDILASSAQFAQVYEHKSTPFKRRYDGFFMPDSPATQLRFIPPEQREVTGDTVARVNRLHALRQRGKRPLRGFYQGSSWWAFNKACMDQILVTWENDPWLRESFEFSLNPDEHYFHTILGENNMAPPLATLVHTEWDVPSPPRIFKTIEDIISRRGRGSPFIRKVRLPASDLFRYVDGLLI